MTVPVFNLSPVGNEEWLALCAQPRFAELDRWIRTNPPFPRPSTDTPGVAEHSGSGVTNPRKATAMGDG